MVNVLKADGRSEPFSKEKVESSLIRAGIDNRTRKQVLKALRENLYEGIPTKEVYFLVAKILDQKRPFLSSRYNLKKAIMDLGPSGYPFESFIAGILRENGFKTEISKIIKGKCVSHEIDILTQKNSDLSAIECKFHNRQGTKTDVKTALYLYGRFLDIKDRENIKEVWLVTNTKLTSRAVSYCNCVGIKAISWNYKGDWSLRSLVQKSSLYPVTCLKSLSRQQKEKILLKGIVFCRDLIRDPDLNFFVPQNKLELLKQEINSVLPA